MHACHRPRVTEHRFPDLGLNLIVNENSAKKAKEGKF